MKNQKRMKGTKLESLLNDVIEQHEKFKNSYFWSPPQGASSRRSYEKKFSREPIKFQFQDKLYEIFQEVSCSCKNVYYSFSVRVDDSKKNIRALKKLVAA